MKAKLGKNALLLVKWWRVCNCSGDDESHMDWFLTYHRLCEPMRRKLKMRFW